MHKKLAACLVVIASLCTAAWAQSELYMPNLDRAVRQQKAQAAFEGLKKYKNALLKVNSPQEEAIVQAIENLSVYNELFAKGESETAKHRLAELLNAPVQVGWDGFGGHTLIKILDKNVPNSHGNQAVADIEYYVKLYTLPRLVVNQAKIVGKQFSTAFNRAYATLQQTLLNTKTYSAQEIAKALAKFGKEYNAIYEKKGLDGVVDLNETLFLVPNKTGWDKSVSVKELLSSLEVANDLAGGDDIRYRSVEEVEEMYNLSREDAESFVNFALRVLQ